jgi:hypothetical protein
MVRIDPGRGTFLAQLLSFDANSGSGRGVRHAVQKSRDIGRGDGLAEQISLPFGTSIGLQIGQDSLPVHWHLHSSTDRRSAGVSAHRFRFTHSLPNINLQFTPICSR